MKTIEQYVRPVSITVAVMVTKVDICEYEDCNFCALYVNTYDELTMKIERPPFKRQDQACPSAMRPYAAITRSRSHGRETTAALLALPLSPPITFRAIGSEYSHSPSSCS